MYTPLLRRGALLQGNAAASRLALRPLPPPPRRALTAAAGAPPDAAEPADPAVSAQEPQASPLGGEGVFDKEVLVFLESIFPIRLGTFDPRHLIASLRQDAVLSSIRSRLASASDGSWVVRSVEPRMKDGGAFVRIAYRSSPGAAEGQAEGEEARVEKVVKAAVEKDSGKLTWSGVGAAKAFLVKGKPWMEDLYRFPSPRIRVEFDGPDVPQQPLYSLFRPYGHIADLHPPSPVSKDLPRATTVAFNRLRSATAARNCLDGHVLRLPDGAGQTRLGVFYERQIARHAVRDWLTSHPRLVLPVIVFLLGSISYAIFNPVREWFVESKLLGRFDLDKNSTVSWLRTRTLSLFSSKDDGDAGEICSGVWRDRKEAVEQVEARLKDYPSTFITITGPRGSGKSALLQRATRDRRTLTIDCAEVCKASSDAGLVSALAEQTGYWPVFGFLASASNLLDLAAVGVMGQKAGFATPIEDQLKQVLEVTAHALTSVSSSTLHDRECAFSTAAADAQAELDRASFIERARRNGVWHDGRLDCIAGNGIMSELGLGLESDEEVRSGRANEDDVPTQADAAVVGVVVPTEAGAGKAEEKKERRTFDKEREAVEALPVVVIKGFEAKGAKKEVLFNVLAEWAAGLVSNRAAHVIIVSDNTSANKRLARALPNKPLAAIGLADADRDNSFHYIATKLGSLDPPVELRNEDRTEVERLGGRLTDLEDLIHKVRSGSSVREAVEELIAQNVIELRQAAFGEDMDAAKELPWLREQVWLMIKALATNDKLKYADVLADWPFKGKESALHALEHHDLIMIFHKNGRPSLIHPGKPIYRSAFERLLQDTPFRAMQDMYANAEQIASAESTVKACETELLTLKNIGLDAGKTMNPLGPKPAPQGRAEYLLAKMRAAGDKIEKLEADNAELRKKLSLEA